MAQNFFWGLFFSSGKKVNFFVGILFRYLKLFMRMGCKPVKFNWALPESIPLSGGMQDKI